MIRRGAFLGSVATVGLILFASAGNWFVTPVSHPDAGPLRNGLVLAQAVVGVAIAVWSYGRIAVESQAEPRDSVSQE